MPDTQSDDIAYIVFRASPENPNYINSYPNLDEAQKAVSEQEYLCAVLLVPVSHEMARACFDFVNLCVHQMDEEWTRALASGAI